MEFLEDRMLVALVERIMSVMVMNIALLEHRLIYVAASAQVKNENKRTG